MDQRHEFIFVLKEVFQTALVSLAIFLFVYVFLVQPHRVKGESMVPTFEDGELLLTEKVYYRLSDPKRGDTIVFQAPIAQKVDFIKRIIGLPGETITIKDGRVYADGNLIEEPYANGTTSGNEEIELGEDEYFVMGDNRGSSSDSRSFGPIEKKTIRGRVWFVYWPIFESTGFEGVRLISRVHY